MEQQQQARQRVALQKLSWAKPLPKLNPTKSLAQTPRVQKSTAGIARERLETTQELNNFETPTEENDNDELFGMEEETPTKQGRYVKVTAVADSGAVVSVMPDKLLPFIKATPSKESKAKKMYRGAGGEPIQSWVRSGLR